ncbi:hypothetical protein [Clostridium tertium]|uniref:Uncharacterized protein n=1 Tax=Clostridium tertium TaxID=1559 RepID=A0A6N3EC83_9CLOT
MVLKDDYGKNMILLDEENLIYKGTFRKKIIKREEIRSAFYDEVLLGILTYSGRIYSLNIAKLLFSEREKLENLRLELNKENILFDYMNYRSSIASLPFIIFFMPMIIGFGNRDIVISFILLILFIFYAMILKKIVPNNVYNIDRDEVEILRGKHTFKYKKTEIDKIKLRRSTDLNTIEFNKNGNKYVMYFKESPYLMKIYNLSLGKLFN